MHLEDKQRIVISGANGFIGSFLVQYLSAVGFEVVALARSAPPQLPDHVSYYHFDLNEGLIDNGVLQKDDIIIHCAYSKEGSIQNDINTDGIRSIIKQASKVGVKKHIYFSSIAARSTASSYYGTHKYTSANLFGEQDAVLTTGLVVGKGGLFAGTLSFIKRARLIPIIQGGRQPIYFVGLHDVAKVIHKIVLENLSGKFLIANPTPVSYMDFYKHAAVFNGMKVRTVNMPITLIKLAIYLNSFLKRPIVTNDNLLGLMELKLLDNVSDLKANIIQFADLKEVFQRELE